MYVQMYSVVYTSCACSRTPHALCWGKNNIICYASCNSVRICSSADSVQVYDTLIGHTDKVNSVSWVQKVNDSEHELLTASADSTVKIYRKLDTGKFIEVTCLRGHLGSVSVAKGFQHSDITLIATSASDSKVKLWERNSNEGEFLELQELCFGNGFAFDVAWTLAPKSTTPMLLCGCDDHKVHIYVRDTEGQGKFTPLVKLIGHTDWIRSLSVLTLDSGDLFVASSSQDTYIRIWRLTDCSVDHAQSRTVAELGAEEEIRLSENIYTYSSEGSRRAFAVTLETVLSGHEGWVYSVQWRPQVLQADGSLDPTIALLSASMDKSVAVWTPDPCSGVWLEQARMGDVGGNSLGYYGAGYSPDGTALLSHGYLGGLRLWTLTSEGTWALGVTCGGHYAPVEDICWQPLDGRFLLSTSLDQTTRCHGSWHQGGGQKTWHEIARPQVHGYDLQCLTMIDRYTFASGADEKVIRIFKATRNFVENLALLEDVDNMLELVDEALPAGASVPALGLSNKAVFNEDLLKPRDNLDEQYPEHAYQPYQAYQPPSEGDLMQNTLWPEIHKLYGHGYEIFAVTAHPTCKLLASACKAAKSEHAAVFVWRAEADGGWKQVQSLAAHSLTVTQLEFSHSGSQLLSVSRDRTWALYERTRDSDLYKMVALSDKKTGIHSRIIWSCSWSHDDKYFVTVSRDKKAVVWGCKIQTTQDEDKRDCLGQFEAKSKSLELADSITAVDFAPVPCRDASYLVAFGLESGEVEVYKWSVDSDWTLGFTIPQSEAHHLTVKRLRFQPIRNCLTNTTEDLLLASVGSDQCVRLFQISLLNL